MARGERSVNVYRACRATAPRPTTTAERNTSAGILSRIEAGRLLRRRLVAGLPAARAGLIGVRVSWVPPKRIRDERLVGRKMFCEAFFDQITLLVEGICECDRSAEVKLTEQTLSVLRRVAGDAKRVRTARHLKQRAVNAQP